MVEIRSFGQEEPVDRPADATELFKLHHAFVWRVLRHLGVSAADQEDVLQEVFVVVHRRLGDYRERDKLRAWLYAICAHVARDYRRRVGRRREELRDAPDLRPDPSEPQQLADWRALSLAQRVLATLPEKQRAVFLLYEIEQLSMTEIALAVDCPIPTAYARLRKARARVLSEVARMRLKGDLR